MEQYFKELKGKLGIYDERIAALTILEWMFDTRQMTKLETEQKAQEICQQ